MSKKNKREKSDKNKLKNLEGRLKNLLKKDPHNWRKIQQTEVQIKKIKDSIETDDGNECRIKEVINYGYQETRAYIAEFDNSA